MDATGKVGPSNTIYLIDVPGCTGKPKKIFLHEMGHSLGVAHDGPGCPATIMKPQLPLPSYKVSSVNCTAVERFKQEKVNRDEGTDPGGGGGDPPGDGANPSRGDDPISRCSEDPDSCVEVEQPMTCTSTWDPENQVYTLTCNY